MRRTGSSTRSSTQAPSSTARVALAVIDFTQSMAETHVLHPAGTNMMGFDLPFLEHYLFTEDQWGVSTDCSPTARWT